LRRGWVVRLRAAYPGCQRRSRWLAEAEQYCLRGRRARGPNSPLVALAWVVYLSPPFSVHPSLVVLPFAALFALSVSIMAGTFKKYL
jgi:hypothetical protein